MDIKLPDFNHPEVKALYEYDLSIPKEIVEKILTLPRTTLIEDMETILEDWLERNTFFKENEQLALGWCFHFHAIWILVEIKAEESLPTLYKILQQDAEFGWYWFSDYTTEDFWEVFYLLAGDRLDELQHIQMTPGNWVFRIIASTVAEQIYFHQPERKTEILAWYDTVLDDFIAAKDNTAIADPEVIATIVCDLINIKAKVFLPKIRKLYNAGLIPNGITGNLASIEKDIISERYKAERLKPKTSIYERYEDALGWYSYQDAYGEKSSTKTTISPTSPSPSPPTTSTFSSFSKPVKIIKREAKKVGRNDPCPCGSGKKYKKCCLRK